MTRVGRDTRVARIIHLVEEAQAQRAPIQSFVDRFGRVYTPAVIAARAGGGHRAAARRRAGAGLDLSRARAAGRLVPVRARDLDAGVDRGGGVGRGQPRRADQGRRGARAPGRGAGAGLRQDRHADRRRAGGRRRRAGPPASRATRCSPPPPRSRRIRAIPWPVAIVAQARHDGVAVPVGHRRAGAPGLGVEGRVDGRDVVAVGNARLMAAARRRYVRGAAGERPAAASSSRSTGGWPGALSLVGSAAAAARARRSICCGAPACAAS